MYTRPAESKTEILNVDQKCTIYYRGGLGIVRMEVKNARITAGNYAQYPAALTVKFRQPRKRKDNGMVLTYDPYLVIVAGWDTPAMPSMFGPTKWNAAGTCGMSKARYSSCDPQADIDANKILSSTEELFNAKYWDTTCHHGTENAEYLATLK